ncbi:MAG TPA: S1 RNA-binding domain-containing protein, partial [Alphaproteobacteria bacterium]|nr:S1 RNA-binding domain-containing protein [Alphaproteobacteria bacterium]
MTETTAHPASEENFGSLLEESLRTIETFEHTVAQGRVVGIEGDFALVDVGLKSEGRVPLKEFAGHGGEAKVAIGDLIDVYVERIEDKNGEAVLSREKARREEAWTQLEKAFKENQR